MTSQQGENTPLLHRNNSSSGSGYYFLNAEGNQATSGNNNDEGEYVETFPQGASADDFAPRILGVAEKQPSMASITQPPSWKSENLVSRLFGSWKKKDETDPSIMVKPRKAPIKVEPKVFFANERTFLAWMHVSIILAGASIAILAFSDHAPNRPGAELYGVVTLPVAVIFIVYAMIQYTRRAYMIRNKHPGPYEDTVGPTILGVVLMLSITAQFGIKLYSMQ